MVQVIKKKKETALSLLKRFHRKIQQSGNLLHVKSHRFKERKKSEYKKRRAALGRISREKKKAELYKLGKLEMTYKYKKPGK